MARDLQQAIHHFDPDMVGPAAMHLLQAFLVGVKGTDPVTFAAATMLLFLIAIVALLCSGQTRQAGGRRGGVAVFVRVGKKPHEG